MLSSSVGTSQEASVGDSARSRAHFLDTLSPAHIPGAPAYNKTPDPRDPHLGCSPWPSIRLPTNCARDRRGLVQEASEKRVWSPQLLSHQQRRKQGWERVCGQVWVWAGGCLDGPETRMGLCQGDRGGQEDSWTAGVPRSQETEAGRPPALLLSPQGIALKGLPEPPGGAPDPCSLLREGGHRVS